MSKYKLNFQGLPMNYGRRMDAFARRALDAFQCGGDRGHFIVAEHQRLGHSLSWDALRLVHDMWEVWESQRESANFLAEHDRR